MALKEKSLMYSKKELGEHIRAELRDVRTNYGIHWHTYFELELVVDGEAIHHLNGKSSKIGRGSLVIIAPTDFHGIEPLSPMKLWNVSFDESLLSQRRLTELSRPERVRELTLDEDTLEKAVSLMNLLSGESKRSDGGCSAELCECLLTVLARQGSKAKKERSSDGGIGRAILYMNIHFRDDPSLDTVAAQAGFHPHYFSELFGRVTGKSFSSYLAELKIDYAKNMLDSGFSVTETCHRSGFGSLSTFLTAFKKATGTTPSEYKKARSGN